MDATSETRMGLPIDEQQLSVPPFQDVKVQCCPRLRKRAEGPIRISFEGNIGVGKSTILKLLNSHPQICSSVEFHSSSPSFLMFAFF